MDSLFPLNGTPETLLLYSKASHWSKYYWMEHWWI